MYENRWKSIIRTYEKMINLNRRGFCLEASGGGEREADTRGGRMGRRRKKETSIKVSWAE